MFRTKSMTQSKMMPRIEKFDEKGKLSSIEERSDYLKEYRT